MNHKISVDSSIAIKWYFEEDESELEEAQDILTQINNGSFELIVPRIILLEIINSSKYSKGADKNKCSEVLSLFKILVEKFAELPSVDSIIERSYSANIASYDAAYVALADKLNIPLFTADYKHHHKSTSKNIIWLKDWNGTL